MSLIHVALAIDDAPQGPLPPMLTKDKARRIAANIAKLPQLLKRPFDRSVALDR
jgi:hypothetical protein